MRQLIDNLKANPDLEIIKRLARLAYDIRHSGPFRALLKTHCQQRHHSSQIIERLGKIAKFFRSAVSLIWIAADDTLKFKHIEIATVPSISRSMNILRDHTIGDIKKRLPALSRRFTSQATKIQRLLRRW